MSKTIVPRLDYSRENKFKKSKVISYIAPPDLYKELAARLDKKHKEEMERSERNRRITNSRSKDK